MKSHQQIVYLLVYVCVYVLFAHKFEIKLWASNEASALQKQAN